MSDGDSQTKSGSWLSKFKNWLDQEPKDREDLLDDLKEAFEKEIIDADAWRMLQGVMELSAQRVRDIMVPRSQIVTLDERESMADNVKVILEAQHSRYPVTGENRDTLVGVLMAKDLLTAYLRDPCHPLESMTSLYRPIFYVPEGKRATELLREFQSRRLHMAIVVDEYGGLAGLVTIEDIIEGIVGEIEDEYDETDVPILQMNETTFTVKALTEVNDVNKFFDVDLDKEVADTIGGLLASEMGRVPQTGESLSLQGLTFKVLRADRRRVHLFKVTRELPIVNPSDDNA